MAVWKITESVSELKEMLWMFPHEEFKFESRNLHWLASRVVLQELLKDKILHEEHRLLKMPNGKPYITGLDCEVSLSHSGEYAAVMISRSGRVGVDIEEINERIKKIARKFINDYEWQHLEGENDLHTMYLLWAAKEAIFKWYGDGEVDFRKHMKIIFPGNADETCYHAVLSKEGETLLKVYHQIIDDRYQLCWVY